MTKHTKKDSKVVDYGHESNLETKLHFVVTLIWEVRGLWRASHPTVSLIVNFL